jgi:hypothetical protein
MSGVEPRGFEPLTSAVQRRRDVFANVRGHSKTPYISHGSSSCVRGGSPVYTRVTVTSLSTLGDSSLILANGTPEAVTPEDFVLSNELGRIVFIPREAVVQMELYDPNRSDTGVDF